MFPFCKGSSDAALPKIYYPPMMTSIFYKMLPLLTLGILEVFGPKKPCCQAVFDNESNRTNTLFLWSCLRLMKKKNTKILPCCLGVITVRNLNLLTISLYEKCRKLSEYPRSTLECGKSSTNNPTADFKLV